jgi:hypothetical protein
MMRDWRFPKALLVAFIQLLAAMTLQHPACAWGDEGCLRAGLSIE